jgi:hypothetical protein
MGFPVGLGSAPKVSENITNSTSIKTRTSPVRRTGCLKFNFILYYFGFPSYFTVAFLVVLP